MKLTICVICLICVGACSVNKKRVSTELPVCLEKMIDSMKKESLNLPESITMYTYKSQTVYYVVSGCCDQYNLVYDSECNYLGALDGGIIGRGDNKLRDFKDSALGGNVVWKKE
jgi:hypothetical protein